MVQFDYLSQWEDNYNSGKEINLYPFSDLVSSYFHSQKLLPTFSEKSLRALDIGCGCGNNLWFLAEQGMDVIGVDVSPTAIKYAEKIMKDRNVKGEAIVSTFQNFSGQIESFDLIIDRACLTHNPIDFVECVDKVFNLLKSGGLFYTWVFDWDHGLRKTGTQITPNGFTNFKKKSYWNNLHTFFLSSHELKEFYGAFKIIEKTKTIQRLDNTDVIAYWSLMLQKI